MTGRTAAAIALALVALTAGGCGSGGGGGGREDALTARVRGELDEFTGWLQRYHQRGFIGEVGWPGDRDAARWNALARRWYGDADRARLWVTAWATGEWWPDDYNLAIWTDENDDVPGVDTPHPQARVIESQRSHDGLLRGVNDAGGAFGAPSIDKTSDFSNTNPGAYDTDYHFDGPATFRYLAARGVALVRIEFRWERIQPKLQSPLDGAELGRLRRVVRAAGAAGLKVVLDLHNYGAYYLDDKGTGVRRDLGSPQLPTERLGDVWSRLAHAFAGEQEIVAFGLMNEPVGLPGAGPRGPERTWERASQQAVQAIRATGDRRTIMVGGYFYSQVQGWPKRHPRPWIDDPADNIRYEAHHYWDADRSSTYKNSYAELDAMARRPRGG